ncbi:MAG: TonB-dependent receptor [Prevotella sp.]|nr:TonB-dependent receptor [Prevotella sp.]
MKKTFIFSMLLTATTVTAAPIDSLKAVELQGVQVSSTRASKNTPMAFSDMNRDEIKAVNYGQDIPFLLSLTPSVTVTSDAGNGIGYTSIRVRGTDATRVNVTANGIPMNDAESAGLYWVNMGDFASSVQSMQIQRGVGTSTNGAGAFGATLNMQTENIGMQPYVGVDMSGGSYYSHKETVRFSTGIINGHWGLQGRLSNIGSKGYLDRASAKLNSYFLQAGYFGENTVVKFITFNGQEETYHAWNYTSKYEQSLYGRTYNSCGLMYTDADGNKHYYDNQTDNYHQQHYQLLWNQLLSRTLSMNVALHYTKGEGYYEQYKNDYGYDDEKLAKYGITNDWTAVGTLVNQKKMDNDFYGAIASLNFDNHQGLQATIGGGWNKYVGDHFGLVKWSQPVTTVYPDKEYYRNTGKKTDMNVYGKVNWEFLKGMSAFVDLQYRHLNYKMNGPLDKWNDDHTQKVFDFNDNYNFFNPKFGLNYEITPNHRVYASYAIAHKEPTRNDYEDNFGIGLKAERLNDLEIGYKFLSPSFSAGANFYWMDYKDQFVLTGELNPIGEAKAMNVAESYRMGVELEAAWKPVSWFRWDVNATFSTNKVKNAAVTLKDKVTTVNVGDTHLAFSPDAIANNIFTFSYDNLKASIQSQYVGEQYLTNSGFKSYTNYDANGNPESEVSMMLDSHFTTNLDLSYTFALKQFGMKEATVGVTLYNLFSAKFDNNGWASPKFRQKADGSVEAYRNDDLYEAGFAPSAPFNFMAHLSLNF